MDKKMGLYELDITMQQLLENGIVWDEETGEITFTSEDIDKLEMAINTKVNNIIGYIKNLDLNLSNLLSVKNDFDKRAKRAKSEISRLKDYLKEFMIRNNVTEKKYINGDVSFRNSISSEVYDEEKLLQYINSNESFKERFLKYKDPDFSVSELKKAITEDESKKLEIPGFRLVENKNLSISGLENK